MDSDRDQLQETGKENAREEGIHSEYGLERHIGNMRKKERNVENSKQERERKIEGEKNIEKQKRMWKMKREI